MCFGTADWQGLFHTIQSNQVRCCSVLLPLMWSRCVSISNGKDTLTTSLYWFRLTTAKGKSVRSCSEWLRLPHWACCLMEGEHERMGHTGWPFRQSLFGADVISHKKWWTYICWEGKKDRLSLSHTHTDTSKHTYRTVAPWPCSRFCGTDTRRWRRLPTASESGASASEASGPSHVTNHSIKLYYYCLLMLTTSLSWLLVKALPSPYWSPATSASHLHPPELLETKEKKRWLNKDRMAVCDQIFGALKESREMRREKKGETKVEHRQNWNSVNIHLSDRSGSYGSSVILWFWSWSQLLGVATDGMV